MKKLSILFMLIPFTLAGCNGEGRRGTVVDLKDEANREGFIQDVSELLFNTCEELSANGLQLEGIMDKMNAAIDIEAYYKDEEKAPATIGLGAKASGLTDFKVKGIDQPAQNLHAEVNVREFNGGLTVSNLKGTNLEFLVDDAELNGYLMQNRLYLDTANESFQQAFAKLIDNIDEIITAAGISEEDYSIPDEFKYAMNGFTTGEFNKFYLDEIFREKIAEKPILGRDLYTLAYLNFQEDNIRQLFDSLDIYDLVTYTKYKRGDFSLSVRLTDEYIANLIGLEEDETIKNSVISLSLRTDSEKRLHKIDLNAQINVSSIAGPILGKYSGIDHYVNTTKLDLDYTFNVFFNPQFTDINKAQFFDFFAVMDILTERYEELISEEEVTE